MDSPPPISYRRIRRRRRPHGFRLNSRRFSVSKLRAKFLWLLTILNRWRRSYWRSIHQMIVNKGSRRCRTSSSKSRGSGSGSEAAEFPRCGGECRLRSFRRSNSSFYAEAIADCLDFIKRSSVSIDGAPASQPRIA